MKQSSFAGGVIAQKKRVIKLYEDYIHLKGLSEVHTLSGAQKYLISYCETQGEPDRFQTRLLCLIRTVCSGRKLIITYRDLYTRTKIRVGEKETSSRKL